MKAAIDDWLQTLGYDGSVGVVHRAASDVRPDHPYAREIELMLRAPGAAAAGGEIKHRVAFAAVRKDGALVEVEADLSNQRPEFRIIGLPDKALGEAVQRVHNASASST